MSPQRIALALLGLALILAGQAAADDYELRPLSGPRADIAALILGGQESGSLRATGLAVASCVEPASTDSDMTRVGVLLNLEIEGRSLLDAVAAGEESEVPESVRVELYVYVMTREGEIVAASSKWVRLPLTDLVSRLPGGGVKLVDRLDLPPGQYQMRVLVRDARSQQFALRVLGVVVPDGSDPNPGLTQPLFPDSSEPWLVARGDEATTRELLSALPVVTPGKPRPFTLRGCHLSDAAFEARLLTNDRQSVAGARIRLDPPVGQGVGQLVRGEIDLDEMEAGLYLLEVELPVATGDLTTTLPVFVTPADELLTWTAIGSLTAEPEARDEDLDLAGRSGSAKRVRAIENAYYGALDLLASGRLEAAVGKLVKLEYDVLAAHETPRKALKWLTEAQNRVTRKLLRHDPECLLPLLMLHLELQSRYVGADSPNSSLLNATRTRVRALANVYATDAKQEMAPALAAMSLAELARILEESGQLVSALIVLREALALDRENTDVILDLAYQYEHHGFRSEALDLLRRLVELDPRSDEGRLRLAMSLFHIERSNDAVALLRQLISNGSSEWALAVAYQELGNYLLRRERFEDAAGLLEEGVRRLPDVQRLRIQLTYSLDRVGRRKRGREIIATLPPDTGRPSPRLLYRIPDRGEDLRSRSELVRHGTARLPLLAAALAESEVAE